MTKRIIDKIEECRKYLGEFERIIPNNFEDYTKIEKKAACERYIEKIVEVCCDLGYLILKNNQVDLTDFDGRVFDKLYEIDLFSTELLEKMIKIKGMRNLIIHQYGNIDNKVIFGNLNNLITDINKFLRTIEK